MTSIIDKLQAFINIRSYKKVLAGFAVFELMRGLLIVLTAWLMQAAIIEADFGITLAVAMIGRVAIENVRSKRFTELSLNIQEELRQRLHKALFEKSLPPNSGELLTLMFDTVEAFDDFFVRVLPNLFTMVILIPMIIAVTFVTDPLTALIFLLTLPVAPFLLYLIGNAISQRNQEAMARLSKLNEDFRELTAAITTLKIFKQSEAAVERLKSTSTQSAEATLEVLRLAFVSAFALELITTLSIALIAVTVGLRLVDDSIAFNAALFLLILAPEFYSPIRQIGAAFHAAVKVKDAALREERIVKSEENYSLLPIPYSLFPTPSFTVVTGESGSGKSTLLRRVAGNSWQIADRDGKKEAVAYMPQRPHIFKTTIRDNVTLFKEVDDTLICQALNDVNLPFKPSDKAEGLSTGEVQRLALARVLVSAESGASILILDEPTAALDVNTKQLIISLIVRLRQRHTLIIATHDPELISRADKVINL